MRRLLIGGCRTRVDAAWKIDCGVPGKFADPLFAVAAGISLLAVGQAVSKLCDQDCISLPRILGAFRRHAPDSHTEVVRTVSERGQLRNERRFFAPPRQCVVLARPL